MDKDTKKEFGKVNQEFTKVAQEFTKVNQEFTKVKKSIRDIKKSLKNHPTKDDLQEALWEAVKENQYEREVFHGR